MNLVRGVAHGACYIFRMFSQDGLTQHSRYAREHVWRREVHAISHSDLMEGPRRHLVCGWAYAVRVLIFETNINDSDGWFLRGSSYLQLCFEGTYILKDGL